MEQMAVAVGHKWKSFHNKEEDLSGLDSIAPSTGSFKNYSANTRDAEINVEADDA